MKLPPDFRDLLAEFAHEGVKFAIIGGYAFAFHAEPRATKDLDLLIGGSADNVERAAKALTRYGVSQVVAEGVRHQREDEIVYFGVPPLRVDILRAIDGVRTEEALARAVPTEWDGEPVRVLALDDLVANKRAAGRARDLADVERLEEIRRSERR